MFENGGSIASALNFSDGDRSLIIGLRIIMRTVAILRLRLILVIVIIV